MKNILEELDYLVGSPEQQCNLLSFSSNSTYLEQIFNRYKTDRDYKFLCFINIIQNPVGEKLAKSQVLEFLKPLGPLLLSDLRKTIAANPGFPVWSLREIFFSLTALSLNNSPIGPRPIGIYRQPVPIAQNAVLIKIIQHPNYTPSIGHYLEELIIKKKCKYPLGKLLPYLLKVSTNNLFIEMHLEKLIISTRPKQLKYSLNHILVNPNLTTEQLDFIRSNFTLKPRQKIYLANHPHNK